MGALDCDVCGMGDMVPGPNSALYCQNCGTQATNYVEEAIDREGFAVYSGNMTRKAGRLGNAEVQQSQTGPGATSAGGRDATGLPPEAGDGWNSRQRPVHEVPLTASQFGQRSYPAGPIAEDSLASMIRTSYVGGLQRMLQLQCETLVKQFGVTPLICGVVGPLWLRYVASTRVFEKVWAEEAIQVAEYRERTRKGNRRRVFKAPVRNDSKNGICAQKIRTPRQPKARKRKDSDKEPRTSFGHKCSFVWLSALKERIPLSLTLAFCYLSCYIVREPVLPTDITRWASEGQLPYLAAVVDIAKPAIHRTLHTAGKESYFPMSPDLMFRPEFLVGSRMLEIQAGFIADRVAIQRPPVNFYSVCSRFLTELRLPRTQLLCYASRLYDWHVPSGLWLSGRELAIPIRIYVMAMLVVAMKILYKLDCSPFQQKEAEKVSSGKNNGHHETQSTAARRIRSRAAESGKAIGENGDCRYEESNEMRTGGMQTVGMPPSNKSHAITPDIQVLGKRRRSLMAGGRRDGLGTMSLGEGEQVSGEASGASFLDADGAAEEDKTELDGSKELITILESHVKVDSTDYDERLARYLRYCQDVVFHGYDHDVRFQQEADFFMGRYEKERKSASELERRTSGITDDEVRPTGSRHTIDDKCMDVPSSGSMRRDNSGHKLSKQQKQKGKDGLRSDSLDHEGQRTDEYSSSPGRRRPTGKQGSSRPISEMKRVGFSCLPPLRESVQPDMYVRYSFFIPGDSDAVFVHRDYFKVLQACSNVINVDARTLHYGVQIIEKGLLQVESKVQEFFAGMSDKLGNLADAFQRNGHFQWRYRIVGADNSRAAAERTEHLTDLSYMQ